MKALIKKTTGIYEIKNLVNGKKYIGSSATCLKGRWNIHLRDLKSNKHHSCKLQFSFNKYGVSNFEITVLALCPKEYCIKLEQWFIDNFKPELNISKTAGSILGCKRPDAAKEITRKYRTGKKASDETKERLRISHLGQKVSAEKRKKTSLFFTGRKHTIEAIKKISDSKIGKPRSDETKYKLRLKSLGNTNLKGFSFSEKSKEKMRNSHLGKKRSRYSVEKGIASNLAIRASPGYIDASCSNTYTIQLPEGQKVEINNAKLFANKNNIPITSLRRTFERGKPYKGYQILSVNRNDILTHYGL